MHVSPQQFLLLAQAVKLVGGDPHPAMARAGLPNFEAMQLAPWRSIAELDAMMRITREVTGDPGFGLVAATSLAHSMYGTLAQLTVHASSLRVILDDLCCYSRLLQSTNELSFSVRGDRCMLRIAPLGTTAEGRRGRAEQVMGNLMVLLRYYGLQDADVHHVHFTHRPPNHAPRYAEVFGCVFQPNVDAISRRSWTRFQRDRGRRFSLIVDAVSAPSWTTGVAGK